MWEMPVMAGRVGLACWARERVGVRRMQSRMRARFMEVLLDDVRPAPQVSCEACGADDFQAQLNPLRASGRVRMRLPVAAKMALPTAGRMGGSVGSPRPVGG